VSIQIYIIQPNGAQEELNCDEHNSLLEAVQSGGIDGLVGECGGNCACGTCHCYVEYAPEGVLDAVSAEEDQMLDFVVTPRQDNSRLACQIKLTPAHAGMRIKMPERQF
jgi:2Fe-2S ferredoxin